MGSLLDPYAPPKQKGIPGLDGDQPLDTNPLLAEHQMRARQYAIAQQGAQQSQAEETRRQAEETRKQADFQRIEANRGIAPEIPGLERTGAHVSPEGDITMQYQAPKDEGIVFKSPDAAEAAGYSVEGAEVLPQGQGIRITKMARVDKSRGKFTEAESKSILYLDRMKSAEEGLQSIMKGGYDPTSTKNSIMRGAAGTFANPIANEQTQRYENEQRNFLAGVLRKDTGAAVTDKEFALYGPMFFPTWGDKPGTVEQKQQKRQVAMDAIQKGLSSDLVINGVEGTAPTSVPPAGTSQTGPVQVKTPEEAEALPPGTIFITPDGRRKVR